MNLHLMAVSQTKIGDGYTIEGVLVGIVMVIILVFIFKLFFGRGT